MQGISKLAENVLASQEGLSSFELVNIQSDFKPHLEVKSMHKINCKCVTKK